MKNKPFIAFMALLLLASVSFIGCDNDNDGGGVSSQDARALTERDFAEDQGLFANPEEGVVVIFLEPTEAPEVDNLTGGLGFDVIPHRYTRTLNHTFCFEDDNDDSKHFMILLNSDGEEVLRVEANGGCVTEVIEAGDYEMVLTHGGHVDEIEPVFLMPTPEDEQVTKRDEFDQKEIKTANGVSSKMHRYLPGGLVKFFESISNVFTRRARAQGTGTPSADLTTLISTNACVECNLMDVDLFGANLSGADLSGADLSGANLSGADLSEANLSGANLSGAFLFGSNLFEANLSEANLVGANLSGAFLYKADLSGTNLTTANLFGANLSGANLSGADARVGGCTEADPCGANLVGANLSGADLSGFSLNGVTIGTNFCNCSVIILFDAPFTGCQ